MKINLLKTTDQPLSNNDVQGQSDPALPLAIEEFTGKQILYDYVKLSLLSTLGDSQNGIFSLLQNQTRPDRSVTSHLNDFT